MPANIKEAYKYLEETGLLQIAEDEEWNALQKSKLEARKVASSSKDKLRLISNEVMIPRFMSRKQALASLRRIRDILEDE